MDNPAPADPDAIYRRSAAPTPPTLPSISDYWPDAPHRIGPPADHYSDEPTEAAIDALLRSGSRGRAAAAPHVVPVVRRRSRRPAALGFTLAVLLLAGAGVAGFTLTRDDGRAQPPVEAPRAQAPRTPQTPQAPAVTVTPSASPSRATTVSAPVRDRDKAGFELVSDVAVINLRAAELGADLYRITTPEQSSVVPRAQLGEAGVQLFLDDNGERGDAAVTVLLNADVRWSMRITGGVKAGVFDLGAARVDQVDFAGGAARIDLTLPRPDGTLPIRLSGGVNRFEVSTDQGVPVRVRTRRGAGQVRLDGRTDDGVARGASFLSPDWAKSENRIDLDAVAGVGTLRVGRG
ncbi:hypothetical protein [Actinoplanes sp. NPDC049599]|uniref:hypothetical protein n=1 Tax=Actinoplanes sp. NPDC049599 TaxID=3363903 RepID=UPI0037A637E0